MPADGFLEKVWRNGRDTFCLTEIGQVYELQDKCRAGWGEIYLRVNAGTWSIQMIRETIRLGLIGGGMDSVRAQLAIELHVDPPWPATGPDSAKLGKAAILAAEILNASTVGVEGEEVGKKSPADRDNGDDQSSGAMVDSTAPPSSVPGSS